MRALDGIRSLVTRASGAAVRVPTYQIFFESTDLACMSEDVPTSHGYGRIPRVGEKQEVALSVEGYGDGVIAFYLPIKEVGTLTFLPLVVISGEDQDPSGFFFSQTHYFHACSTTFSGSAFKEARERELEQKARGALYDLFEYGIHAGCQIVDGVRGSESDFPMIGQKLGEGIVTDILYPLAGLPRVHVHGPDSDEALSITQAQLSKRTGS